jgi:hypothetical protein
MRRAFGLSSRATWWKELKVETSDGQQIGKAQETFDEFHNFRAEYEIASIPAGARFALTRAGAFGIKVVVRQIPIPDPEALAGATIWFVWLQD